MLELISVKGADVPEEQQRRFHTLNKGYLEELISYYRKSPKMVSSTNILVSLLKSVQNDTDYPLNEYLRVSSVKMYEKAKRLNIVTATSKLEIRDPELLSPYLNEIIYAFDTPLSWSDKSITDYTKISPVNLVSHPFESLSMPYMDGTYKEDTLDIMETCYFTIDIQKLIHSYYLYVNSSQDTKHSIKHFVGHHLLMSMAMDYIQIAGFNRAVSLSLGSDPTNVHYKHVVMSSVSVTPYDRVASRKVTSSSSPRYKDVLSNFVMPLPYSLGGSLEIPRTTTTKHIRQFEYMSKLKIVENLLLLSTPSDIRANRGFVNEFKRTTKLLKQDGTLTKDIHEDLYMYIDYILSLMEY